MKAWIRDPVLWFFAAGAGLFLVYTATVREETTPISLGDAGLALLVQEYEAVTGAPPDAATRAAIIKDYYRREVLFREGLRREIYLADGELREAIIERMQQRVSGELPEPSGRDLVNFYTDHMDRYYSEPTISFEQRFFREEPADPAEFVRILNAGGDVPADAATGGSRFPDYGESMVRGLFGDVTVNALKGAVLGEWFGPVESVDGWHFFHVIARGKPRLLSFAQVEDQVRVDYQSQALDRRLDAFIDQQRERYSYELSP